MTNPCRSSDSSGVAGAQVVVEQGDGQLRQGAADGA